MTEVTGILLINGVALYLLYSENKAKKDLGDQKIALENANHCHCQ